MPIAAWAESNSRRARPNPSPLGAPGPPPRACAEPPMPAEATRIADQAAAAPSAKMLNATSTAALNPGASMGAARPAAGSNWVSKRSSSQARPNPATRAAAVSPQSSAAAPFHNCHLFAPNAIRMASSRRICAASVAIEMAVLPGDEEYQADAQREQPHRAAHRALSDFLEARDDWKLMAIEGIARAQSVGDRPQRSPGLFRADARPQPTDAEQSGRGASATAHVGHEVPQIEAAGGERQRERGCSGQHANNAKLVGRGGGGANADADDPPEHRRIGSEAGSPK